MQEITLEAKKPLNKKRAPISISEDGAAADFLKKNGSFPDGKSLKDMRVSPMLWRETDDGDLIAACADALIDWVTQNETVWFEMAYIWFGLDRDTIERFKRTNDRFAWAMKLVDQWQEVRLIQGALNNECNASFAKFLLGARWNYEEKPQRMQIEGGATINIIDYSRKK